MVIFDPDEVITIYSLKQAVEDGVLVEIFKKRWGELSGGKPIVATAHLFENVSLAGLREIWNEFTSWKRDVELTLPEEERLLSTKMNEMTVLGDRRHGFLHSHVSGGLLRRPVWLPPGGIRPSGRRHGNSGAD